MLSVTAQMTDSERKALRKAVSSDFLDEQGLREGSHGEILTECGRPLFDVGFARAIRTVLRD